MRRFSGGKSKNVSQPSLKGFDDFDLSLGDVLRGERATLGKTLMDVQRELRIKSSYIAAIEDADPSVFETPGFIAGYVRSYAKYLGVDSKWAFDTFCEESGFSTAHGMSTQALPARMNMEDRLASNAASRNNPLERPMIPYQVEKPSRFSGFDFRALGSLIVLVGLIGGLGYGAWSVLQQVQRVDVTPIENPPLVAADIDPLLSRGDQNDENQQIQIAEAEQLDRLYRPEILDSPVLVPRDGPIATLDPGGQGAFVQVIPQVRRDGPLTLRPGTFSGVPNVDLAGIDPQGVVRPVDTPQVVAKPPPEVVLVALDGVWVRVRGSDGSILFEQIMESGDSFVVPQTEVAPTLRAGNSGSLFFLVNGETLGPAGPGTTVVKDVSLSPDRLAVSYTAADIQDAGDLIIADVLAGLIQADDQGLVDPTVSE